MAYVWIEEIGDFVCDGNPWSDFFAFAEECAGLTCVEPILLGEGEYQHRLVVRDEEGWFYTVGIFVEQASHGGYWEPDCGAEWWVDENNGCACGHCE